MITKNKTDFGDIGLAASCSLFSEAGLKYYKETLPKINPDIIDYINERNKCTTYILKSEYGNNIGATGKKILNGIEKYKNFTEMCVGYAPDVHSQSLLYALRFIMCYDFLLDKYNHSQTNFSFVDLGCGLFPFAAIFQDICHIDDTYIIDINPKITDIYVRVSQQISGTIPKVISWQEAKDMAQNKSLSALTSVGCFPYMEKEEQIKRIKFIHKNIPYYLIEIKFNVDNCGGPNTFSLADLMKNKLQIENSQTMEYFLTKNSKKFLRYFLKASNNREFLLHDRSLFLSR